MNCPNCNNSNSEEAIFCVKCGTKLIADRPPEASTQSPPQAENVYADYNANASQAGYNVYGNPPPVKRLSRTKPILITAVSVFLIIAIIAGVFIFSMSSGPLTEISKAVERTIDAKSFSFKGEVNASGNGIKIDGIIKLDLDNRIFELYTEVSEKSTYQQHLIIVLIKDGIVLTDENGRVNTTDIKKNLDEFFDEYDKQKNIKKAEKIDWDELFDTLGISDQIDADLFGLTLNEFIKNLNDITYINEKLATYTKEKQDGKIVHSFKINTDKMTKELVTLFGEAFYLEGEDDYDDVIGDIANNIKQITGGNKFNVIFEVSGNYFSGLKIDTNNLYAKIELDDFNTAEIDEDAISKYNKHFS